MIRSSCQLFGRISRNREDMCIGKTSNGILAHVVRLQKKSWKNSEMSWKDALLHWSGLPLFKSCIQAGGTLLLQYVLYYPQSGSLARSVLTGEVTFVYIYTCKHSGRGGRQHAGVITPRPSSLSDLAATTQFLLKQPETSSRHSGTVIYSVEACVGLYHPL